MVFGGLYLSRPSLFDTVPYRKCINHSSENSRSLFCAECHFLVLKLIKSSSIVMFE